MDEDSRTIVYEPKLNIQDEKLINYLAKHKHWTPFAHAFISLRIKAPIFVARQLVKHQVGLAWNEVSRRYVDEEPEFWFPKEWRGRPDGSVKQGSSGVWNNGHEPTTMLGGLSEYGLGDMEWTAADICTAALSWYDAAIRGGVAPEQARMILPQNMMTEWIWSGSLAAFVRVCKLRLDPHAQLETQMVAEEIRDIISPLFPVSFKALMEY
jgi:thymidylate synthase (FAD)